MSARRINQAARLAPRRTGALALACALAIAAATVARAVQSDPRPPKVDDRDEFLPRAFQLYDTQGARARADEAKEHIAASRWSEALAALQALIEDHRGEVLGASRPQPADARNPSEQDVHPGAGSWAVQQLFALPEAGRLLYRERFGRRAEAALERAIGAADRGALARVAQRWPLTSAAERAWWALGDLEVELGHAGDGLRSWARAAALHIGEPMRVTTTAEHWRTLREEFAGGSRPTPGAVARATLALELLPDLEEEIGSRPRNEASFVRGPATGIAATSITSSRFSREGAAGWPRPFRLPSTPYSDANGASRLFPQRAGDVVIVNTSRSVHALDAFDGSEIWRLDPEQLDWGKMSSLETSHYDKAVDTVERIVTVASSRGIVIAPVQIPWTFEGRDQYNDLSIIEIIPERRLVALDLGTGRPLWNTFPPLGWDGDSGSFAERMTVVGPPTIVGARVLVPMARLRGRIEMHLGCFDLTTGDVLWSAPLVTGQRTLNMFGRANVEFSAPPPVVAGDTVIVATQLGLVASIDLFTGETRWDTLYDQVPIQAPQYYAAGWMQNQWRNAPPVVTGDTIIVAPFDGKELFALDAATGATLWSINQRQLRSVTGVDRRGRRGGLNVLVAADERRLLLTGANVVSIEFENGLRSGPPLGRAWTWPTERTLPSDVGFPTVDAESVFIPHGSGVMVVDRENGREREELSGRVGIGHLLVADGMLFSTDGAVVDARFEWLAMVERARAAVRREDATAADLDMLVRLLLERSRSLLDRGTDVARALAMTDEAERALSEFAPDAGAIDAQVHGAQAHGAASASDLRRRQAQMHRTLMLRVRGERIRGDADAARLAARAALALEGPAVRQLESLLALHEIERARDAGARAEILDELLAGHASERIEVEARVTGGRWSPSVALSMVLESTRRSRSGGSRLVNETLWADPWTGPIVPTSVALAGRREGDQDALDRRTASISVALFTMLSQVEIARTISAPTQSVAGELLGLHAILREVPQEKLFGVVSGDWAEARVRALRALYPSSSAIASFDRDAATMLVSARNVAETSGSTNELDRLRELFPGSPAARSAAEARIEYALASGSPHEVAAIVVEALSHDWHPARSTERETTLILQLATTLGDVGNTELRAGIARNLARYRPDVVVEVAGLGNLTLADVAKRWAPADAPLPTARAAFDNRVVTQRSRPGDFVPVGRGTLAGERAGEAQEVLIVQSRDMQLALASGRSGDPLWSRPSDLGVQARDRKGRVHIGVDSIVVGERQQVVCVDSATGEQRWSFARAGRTIAGLRVSGGVAVIITERTDSHEVAEVYGVDAVLGIELWSLGAIAGRYNAIIKVGDGRFVLLPMRESLAAVHDLYTGYPVSGIRTGRMTSKDAQAAWIDRGRLVTPFVDGGTSRQARNSIIAYDLDDGEESWHVDLDNHAGSIQNLAGIIEMPASAERPETVRLAMLERVDPTRRSSELGHKDVGLYVLNERLGALARTPLVDLDARTYLAGVGVRRRVVVHEALIIAITAGRDAEHALITAIDPRMGVVWKALSARPIKAKGMDRLALPVVGDGVVAMIVLESFGRPGSLSGEKKLMFLDSVSGSHMETRPLNSGSSSGRWSSLAAVGGTLVALGGRRMMVME